MLGMNQNIDNIYGSESRITPHFHPTMSLLESLSDLAPQMSIVAEAVAFMARIFAGKCLQNHTPYIHKYSSYHSFGIFFGG